MEQIQLNERRQEIRILVANAATQNAIQRLMDFIADFCIGELKEELLDECFVLQGNLSMCGDDISERNGIAKAVLSILRDVIRQ